MMNGLHRNLFIKLCLIALLTHLGFASQAQVSASAPYRSDSPDTSIISSSDNNSNFLPDHVVDTRKVFASKPLRSEAVMLEESDRELQKSIASTINKADERKLLLEYLKQMEVDDQLSGNQSNRKVLYRFANLFARLKMYPLAMKCFFMTIKPDKKKGILNDKPTVPFLDTNGMAAALSNQPGNFYTEADNLPINDKDDSLLTNQAILVKNEKSKATTYEKIAGTFNDHKTAVAYALLFHVKQPVPGKKKIFVFSNTGHTFITLIKYNADSTYVSCSFGFYPKKDQPLAATPVYPSSPSQLKNDSGHQWDEVVGKFISKKKFERILGLTKRYSNLEYHLSKNNCTDFCLQAATMAGITIPDTKGKWPLGSGNNPGVTGQSLLNGNFGSANNTAVGGLFSTVNLSVMP